MTIKKLQKEIDSLMDRYAVETDENKKLRLLKKIENLEARKSELQQLAVFKHAELSSEELVEKRIEAEDKRKTMGRWSLIFGCCSIAWVAAAIALCTVLPIVAIISGLSAIALYCGYATCSGASMDYARIEDMVSYALKKREEAEEAEKVYTAVAENNKTKTKGTTKDNSKSATNIEKSKAKNAPNNSKKKTASARKEKEGEGSLPLESNEEVDV